MNTKILLITTALFLGIIGFGLTFLPQEIGSFYEEEYNKTSVLALQLLGALYLGFAMINWMAKESLIGGIYNRPLILGNLLHFIVGAFTLIKIISKYTENQYFVMLTLTILYSIFALCYAYLLRTSPIKSEN